MYDEAQVSALRGGGNAWNAWLRAEADRKADARGMAVRIFEPEIKLAGAPLEGLDLTGAWLRRADLADAKLHGTNLSGANLRGASLHRVNLTGARLDDAILRNAHLNDAVLVGANLDGANCWKASLRRANLTNASLIGATLRNADLTSAILCQATMREAVITAATLEGARLHAVDMSSALLVQTDFRRARIIGCRVYGVAAWDLNLEGAIQRDLIVTPPETPAITVDDVEVAQFINVMLRGTTLGRVIETITSRVVLILGRFTAERKRVLDGLRVALRDRGYVPIVFDFPVSPAYGLTRTMTLLARLSRFIVADLTDPSCVPYELHAIVPTVRVPIVPLLAVGEAFAMFADLFRDYAWVLPELRYGTLEELVPVLESAVIAPAEAKLLELQAPRSR